MKRILLPLLLMYCTGVIAQFEPSAGRLGSTAIYQDSSDFTQWAKNCTLYRGYLNISNPSAGLAAVGDKNSAIGKAGENGVVSLGDAGVAILTFEQAITNGEGYDFAVFENGFKQASDSLDFLEYAFVEVSSDGTNYVRFPSKYNGDTTKQVGSFQATDTRLYHNLAGKYTAGYGTPFDLEEIKNNPNLDILHITQVKVVDVVGSIQSGFASRDSKGKIVNDPWPTEFASSGFDLDAVGVIHSAEPLSLSDAKLPFGTTVFPNPASGELNITSSSKNVNVDIRDLAGKSFRQQQFSFQSKLDIADFPAGIYILNMTVNETAFSQKVIVK